MSANQKRHYLKSYNNVAKLKMTHEFEIQVQICGSVKLVNRIPPPLDNWVSKDNTNINKQTKSHTDALPLKITCNYKNE
jgi:hypothetical protein